MKLSLIMAYFDNPSMLAKQFETLASYPFDIKRCIDYVVVDDCSPRWPAKDVPQPAYLPRTSLFRIKEKVRWNQDAARNIGVHESKGDWLLLTDMDHLVPQSTMDVIFRMSLRAGVVYTFGRVSAPAMGWYKSHPNSWLMHRSMYEKVGGYDERLAGYYGTDGEFRNRLMKQSKLEELPVALIRVPREVIPDASTTIFERKSDHDRAQIKRIIIARSKEPNWTTKRLSFPYERVA
jgi:hypothetical protein